MHRILVYKQMITKFKQYIRYYGQQIDRLSSLKSQLPSNIQPQQNRKLLHSLISPKKDLITLEKLREFLLKYDNFYTDMELNCFFYEFFNCKDSITFDQLEEFVYRESKKNMIQKQNLNNSFLSMKIGFEIYLIINESIKFCLEVKKMREMLQENLKMAEIFKQMKVKYENYVTKTSMSEYLNLSQEIVERFLQNFGQKIYFKDFLHYFQFQQQQEQPEQNSEKNENNRAIDNRFRNQIDEKNLAQYFSLLIKETNKIQKCKENIINTFPNISYESIFLLFASTLTQKVSIQKLEERCRLFANKKITKKALILLILKFGVNNKLNFQIVKSLFQPLHESYKKIMERRKLEVLKENQVVVVFQLFSMLLSLQTKLEENRFKYQNYGPLYLQLDYDNDTKISKEDLQRFLTKHSTKSPKGRDIRIILNRFGRDTRQYIKYGQFVQEMQQKIS